jgi:hypothetical protein
LVKSSAPTTASSSIPKATSTPKESSGKGEKIAIGIAVPLAFLLIGAAVFYFVRHRKRLRRQTVDQEISAGEENSDSVLKPELPGSPAAALSGPNDAAFQKPELDNMQLSITSMLLELPADLSSDKIQELHGHSSTIELGDASTPSSEPQHSISHDTAREGQQKHGSFDHYTGDAAVPGLWDWSNFNTLGEPNESPRNSTTHIRK